MADYNRPPQADYSGMMEFGASQLPPGALVPSIPGYSGNPPSPRASISGHGQYGHSHGAYSRDSYGGGSGGGGGAYGGAHHSGVVGAEPRHGSQSPTLPRAGGGSNTYSMRDVHGALPPVPPPPPPRPGSVRRALPTLPPKPPGVSEAPGGVPPPFQAPPRPVGTGAPNAPTPAGPPQPPLRSMTTRRALPTPPGRPAASATAPLPPPTYDSSPRQLPNPASYQGGSTLPKPPSQPALPKPPSQQQQQLQQQDQPSRQASTASSSYPSHVSHNTTGDSYFGPGSTAEHTSVTSHTSESYKLPYDHQSLANGNHSQIRPDSPPADEATARPYDYQQSTATPYDAQLLDLPGQPDQPLICAGLTATPRGSAAWESGHRFLSTSPSVNSLQTEAAPTPPPFVATPSPIPTPPVPAVSYPDARGAAEQAAASIEFPSARPTSQGPSGHPHTVPGRSPHLGRDLYEELNVPESLDGGHDQMMQPSDPRQPAAASSSQAYLSPVPNGYDSASGSTQTPMPSDRNRPQWAADSDRPWVQNKLLLHQANSGDDFYDEQGDLYDDYNGYASSGEEGEGDEEMNEFRFFNPAYLSEMAVQVRDRVIRGSHVKGGIPWAGSFTGKDVVTIIQTFMPAFTRDGPADRRFALQTAKSLHSQLWLIEVDWESRPLRDSDEDVYKFMSEMEGIGEDLSLPKGVLTMATQCYASSCGGIGGRGCYSPRCPHNTPPNSFLTVVEDEPGPSRPPAATIIIKNETDWEQDVSPAQLAQMEPQERQRQTLIRNAILLEERYEADLATVEDVFITPLETANPPIVEPYGKRDQYVRTIFSNIREIRRSSRALLENFSLHLQQGPLVQTVGDIFLEAAIEFRSLYPTYTDNLSKAEALLSQALEEHRPFAQWMFEVSKDRPERRLDLRYLLKRPAMHLQNYPQIIEEILRITPPDSPDCDFLKEALKSIQNISYLSRLKLWQASKGRGAHGNLTWKDIVAPAIFESMSPNAQKLQFHIWELIQGEMEYVADLEAIDTLYITPLREADNPIIDRSRLEVFIDDAFHNYRSILDVHERFLSELHKRQIEQHPKFGMVSDLMYDAALNWNEAYMEYMPHFPIAKAKIDEEMAKNPRFAAFLEQAYKSPLNPGRQNIIHFVQRPIPRLVRYNLILSDILKRIEQVAKENAQDPHDNADFDQIPLVKDLIDKQAKAGDKGVAVNAAKVELWSLKSSLDGGKLGQRVVKDLDLLNPMRELIHRGKVFRQPEGTISGSWSELTLFLFDNYFVQVKQTKSKNRDAPLRYSINRRPIPLELLSLGDFFQPAQTRSIGVLNKIGGKAGHNEGKEQTQSDSRTVYPFTFSIIGAGLSSGQYTLWTDSEQSRREWHEKLKHAKVLRTEVDEANKVFEFTPLSLDTFYMAPGYGVHPHANQEYTGRVTCSVPFVTVDRRSLVAVGCEQGVWIGVQHDPPSLRKVLHVKNVTQIAVLEEFGIFLVLADKSLLAYHLEALVPTAQSPQVRSAPQRLSGVRDIVFFVVGQFNGLTLVLYVKRKGMDSVFRVLEPVLSRGAEDRRRGALGGLLGQRSEWFRLYKEFFIPTEALHVHFLKAKIAIVCAKGFEIMGLTDLRGGSIPIFDPQKAREKPALAELARLCEQAKPIAMFRSTESEFLLCYDRFGIYVDRHGEPNRDMQPIEWEGTPENIVFHPPYLLLVSPSFIEVRHIDTAKLLQIYTGVDIRCTWDGTGGMVKRHNDAPGPKGWGEEVTSTEPRLHICKRTDDPKRTKGIGQHVFELTPTLLLNNPLLNPVHTQDPNYFPPAPLDHRTSMSNSSGYAGAYPPDSFGAMESFSQIYSPHRRSLSSASTTTYPNPNVNGLGGMGSGGGFTPTPSSQQNLLHPLGRRVSDMSTPSTGAGASASSAFDMPTVYQNEVQDYQGDYFSQGQGRAGSRDDYGSPYAQGRQQGAPPRQASNDWPAQAWGASVSSPPADEYEFGGGGGYGQPLTQSQGGYPNYGAQQRQASYDAAPPRGANDYAQVSQAPGPNEYAQVSQADEYAAYRYAQRTPQQGGQQNQGYQQGGQAQGQGYYR